VKAEHGVDLRAGLGGDLLQRLDVPGERVGQRGQFGDLLRRVRQRVRGGQRVADGLFGLA